MSDLGLLSYYLGIEVHQKLGEITLCQEVYAKKILEKCGMEECNPTHVPMEPRLKLSKRSEAPVVDATEYRSVVGSLRYLINTRPDLAYSVGYVSRFMEAPTMENWTAVKHILRYIKGTTNFGISLSLVRIVEAILFNKNVIMNVSSYLEGEYGLNDLYIGTPTVINGNGADRVIELKLEEDELTRFKQSSHIILEHQQRADALIESILNK